ncbi:right-handed parallel beta-helix repeat-containing protein [bacterium]|nr:right-handed parallel beta-helix repeat-containing protein [bacterium]
MRTGRIILLVGACLLIVSFSARGALSADYYVDAELGSNDNSGLLPDEAFKTITYALDTIRTDITTPATIRLAAGTYSEDTNGETFPIMMTSATSLIGGGPELTILFFDQTESEVGKPKCIFCNEITDVHIEGISIERAGEKSIAVAFYSCHGQTSVKNCSMRGVSNGVMNYTPNRYDEHWILDIEECYIEGGVYYDGTKQETIKSCTFAGGFVLGGTLLTIEDCAFIECYVHPGGNPGRISNCTFLDCGLRIDGGVLTMEKCSVIRGNVIGDTCDWPPSGIDVSINDCLFVPRSDTRPVYAAIDFTVFHVGDMPSTYPTIKFSKDVEPGVKLKVNNCQIANGKYGIRTFLQGSPSVGCDSTITNCRISGTQYPICLSGHSALRNCLITANSGDGYALFLQHGGNVWNCTIAGNDMFGIGASDGQATVRNTILENSGEEITSSGKYEAVVMRSLIEGGFEGEGNIDADPLFVPGPLGDHYLSQVAAGQDADSPCVDAGTGLAASYGLASKTTRTDNVPDAGMVDIGYHYPGTPPTIDCRIATGSIVAAGVDEAPRFTPGDRLTAQASLRNDGPPIWVDIYAGFLCPGGSILCLTAEGLTPDFGPLVRDFLLDTGMAIDPTTLLSYEITVHVPEGEYAFATALSFAREPFRPIGQISTAEFLIMGGERAPDAKIAKEEK